jgi:hypothetical protein
MARCCEGKGIEAMKALSTSLMAIAAGAFLASVALALEVNATGAIPYDSFFSSTPSDSERHAAVANAKLNAWKDYTSSFSMAKQKAYQQLERHFLSSLDDYFIEYAIVADKVDKGTKTFSVMIRAKINDSKVDAKLSSASAAGGAKSGEGSGFGFIFMAREASEVKAFDERKTKITATESTSSAVEKSRIGGGVMSSSESSESMKKEQTGGNTVRKADHVQYTVSSPQDINAAMNEMLAPAGFEVIDYADIVAECGGAAPDVIKSEFGSGYELTAPTRKAAIDAARKCQVTYFAIGTLDVGMQGVDPATGLKRVNVTVNAQVWNIAKGLPRQVASVNSDPYAGLGPDPVVAKRNALKKAADSAAKAIVDQLNAKGVM